MKNNAKMKREQERILTDRYVLMDPAELGGREFMPSLCPRGRPSGKGDRRDDIDRSSCERAKKLSSPSYGDDDALIYQKQIS